MTFRNLLVALAAGSLLILAGCGGSSSTAVAPPPPPEPTPQENCEAADGRCNADMTCTSAAELVIERAYAAIAAAETPEAAQAAYDAVKDNVTATQGTELQAAVDARTAALAKRQKIQLELALEPAAKGEARVARRARTPGDPAGAVDGGGPPTRQ